VNGSVAQVHSAEPVVASGSTVASAAATQHVGDQSGSSATRAHQPSVEDIEDEEVD
jgi:hypothetical protein